MWLLIALNAAVLAAGTGAFAGDGVSGESAPAPANRGRAEIWEQNCGRCHNLRSPASYSDSQWDLIITHMRIRGTLTADEAKAVLELMKAGN